MRRLVRQLVRVTLLSALASPGAFGQGTATTSLSGVIVDSGGGVIPGATVVTTLKGTTTKFQTVPMRRPARSTRVPAELVIAGRRPSV